MQCTHTHCLSYPRARYSGARSPEMESEVSEEEDGASAVGSASEEEMDDDKSRRSDDSLSMNGPRVCGSDF